jgi:class 3 adenylate cyclase
MAEKGFRRKLTAILSADVEGYSRLMGDDEVGTYQTLTAKLESILSIISEHNGRLFSSPGDAVMAEFSSVAHAAHLSREYKTHFQAFPLPKNEFLSDRPPEVSKTGAVPLIRQVILLDMTMVLYTR